MYNCTCTYVTLSNAAASTSSPTRIIIAIELIFVVFYNPRLDLHTMLPRHVEVLTSLRNHSTTNLKKNTTRGWSMVIVGVEGACSSWHLETIIKKPSVKIVSGGKETSYFCLLEKQLPVGDKLWRWRGHEPLAVRGWGSRRTNPTDPNPIQDYRWSDTKCKNRNRN